MTSIFKQAATQSRKQSYIQSLRFTESPQSKTSRLEFVQKFGKNRLE